MTTRDGCTKDRRIVNISTKLKSLLDTFLEQMKSLLGRLLDLFLKHMNYLRDCTKMLKSLKYIFKQNKVESVQHNHSQMVFQI